ncbi:calmodulin-binding transcription activator 2 [Quercus suber]|uniref:Calmodulin-binding transcription activator 2 n=1 Tax=Quercus suber TaxID=58331 RepID=A0AAW0JYJ8_QUESU
MAERGSYGLPPRLALMCYIAIMPMEKRMKTFKGAVIGCLNNIKHILTEAQNRWLRPAEICEILRNYQKFQIASEPPYRPISMILGSRTNIGGIKESDEVTSTFQKDSPLSSSFSPNHNRVPCGSTDSPSPASSLTSLYEDGDSEDVFQASSTSRSFLESQPTENGPLRDRTDAGVLNSYFPHPSPDDHGLSSANYISHVWTDRSRENDDITSPKTIDLASWEEVLEHSTRGFHSTVPSNVSSSSSQPASIGVVLEEENMTLGGFLASGSVVKEEFQNFVPIQSNWQIPLGDNSVNLPIWPTDQSSHLELAYDPGTTLVDPKAHDTIMRNGTELLSTHPVQQNEQPVQNKHQIELTNTESQSSIKSISKMDMPAEGNINYASTLKKHLIDGEQGLKKVDSFSRWASKELGDVDDFHMQTSSGISWSTVECGNVVDDSSLSPSISQDQFFSIIDFSPKWAYTDSENEVLIIGKFLKSLPEIAKCNWSCMFGEVEVPAEVLAIGVLCCHAPPHSVGRVPFYVTCSNRLACSEVREFDYRVGSIKDIDIAVIYGGATTEMLLHMRLERLLSLISVGPPSHFVEGVPEKRELISKVISLKEEEEYYQMAEPISQNDPSQYEVKEHLLKILMKEKLYSWLLHKVSEDGKGPSVLDDEGQGVLHLAAALGYDWAIKPIVTSGTVGFLVSLGASPGALTDPSPEFPLGRTPADLAGVNGHKGISGFLAEHLLTSYLKSLEMNDPNEVRTEVSGQNVSEQTVTPANYGDIPEALSLRDSLTAVSNATLAADRIHLMFRMHSLERRRITEYDDDIVRLSDEHALSVVAAKTRKAKQSDGVVHAAATQIQKKFRGWKKRKEFLIIRQRIVKIQAHVRGHQVRKKYRTIIWSVGILEKVILRWRRKGIGLRGFRSDARTEDPKPQDVPSKEDDYDFLKDGRKQTEERLKKALTRVKSMVQYPEARAQYSRLRTAVEGFRETKAYNLVLNSSEETVVADEDLIDIDTLLEDVEDDSFMSMAFE